MGIETTEIHPSEVWKHFFALSAIPRASGNEAGARGYLDAIAASRPASARTDAFGNLVVTLPASRGKEGVPPLAIQSHLDMVAARSDTSTHDFNRDPIRPVIDEDRVHAEGTTLGADNGIGCALMAALMTSSGLVHGELELIFTVAEEVGLKGAQSLDASLIRSTRLINLDSEDPAAFTIGCAGGTTQAITLPTHRRPPGNGRIYYAVKVDGLLGGHSGIQIHLPRANALKLLTHLLQSLIAKGHEMDIATFDGGEASNAIPRQASAIISIPSSATGRFEREFLSLVNSLCSEWRAQEPGMNISARARSTPAAIVSRDDRRRILGLLSSVSHGIRMMSATYEGVVETSQNLAQLTSREDCFRLTVGGRSLVPDRLDDVRDDLALAARQFQGTCVELGGYPGWQPNQCSDLLNSAQTVYREISEHNPRFQVVHAGLEVGVIMHNIPTISDAVSFGPLILGAHTPQEQVSIKSVEFVWRWLTRMLEI
jgi:dipeptidase D